MSPRAPSRPMPVSTTPMARAPEGLRRGREQHVARGPEAASRGGPSSRRSRPLALHQQVRARAARCRRCPAPSARRRWPPPPAGGVSGASHWARPVGEAVADVLADARPARGSPWAASAAPWRAPWARPATTAMATSGNGGLGGLRGARLRFWPCTCCTTRTCGEQHQLAAPARCQNVAAGLGGQLGHVQRRPSASAWKASAPASLPGGARGWAWAARPSPLRWR